MLSPLMESEELKHCIRICYTNLAQYFHVAGTIPLSKAGKYYMYKLFVLFVAQYSKKLLCNGYINYKALHQNNVNKHKGHDN